MSQVNVTLPFPTSVNALYKPVRYGKGARMIKTTEATKYTIRAKRTIREQLGDDFKPLKKRLKVLIVVHERNNQGRDLDNMFKIPLDAMNGKVWADDSQIDDLRIIRGPKSSEPRMEVTVTES